MPLWLLILVLVASVAAQAFVNATGLWAAGRVVRSPRFGYRTALAVWGGFLAFVIAVGLANAVIGPVVPVLVLLVGLVAVVWVLRRTMGVGWWRAAAAWILTLALSWAVSLLLEYPAKAYWLQSFIITTRSMAPTLEVGDRMLVDKTLAPKRWDAVVHHPPESSTSVHVKRLVGLPGETIEIIDGDIRVNGVLAPKPPGLAGIWYDGVTKYRGGVNHGGTGSPITLGADEYFVLGDNTAASLDSRNWEAPYGAGRQLGAVPRGAIVGVVRVVYWPVARARLER